MACQITEGCVSAASIVSLSVRVGPSSESVAALQDPAKRCNQCRENSAGPRCRLVCPVEGPGVLSANEHHPESNGYPVSGLAAWFYYRAPMATLMGGSGFYGLLQHFVAGAVAYPSAWGWRMVAVYRLCAEAVLSRCSVRRRRSISCCCRR